MEKIGVIGGYFLLKTEIWKNSRKRKLKTPFGIFNFAQFKNTILVCRHGLKSNIPPHKINHKLNVFGLKKLKVKYVFGFNSAASLKRKIKPGSFLVPDDFIDFDPPTFFDSSLNFITPRLSERIRKILIKALSQLKVNFWPKGIYFNTKGPRLETKAEINFIKKFADVVGMTMAKEATLAQELTLEYASLCSIDNFAHGITKTPLSQEDIFKAQEKSAKIFEKIIKKLSQ
jgi:5'-methylthioadenosine phosphorylase